MPVGVRKSAATHKKRRPIDNTALAMMHAAKGRETLSITDEDQRKLENDVREYLARIFNGKKR